MTSHSKSGKIDFLLFQLVILISLFGILMVFEASSINALQYFGDKYYYVRQQFIWLIVGFIFLCIFSKINYRIFQKFAPLFFIVNTGLLLMVLIPGIGTKIMGARRWLNLGFIGIQPAELAKLTQTIFLASIFSKKPRFLPFILIVGILVALIMLEPDLGTAVILTVSGFFIYFVSGASISSLLGFVFAGISGGLLLILGSPYRRDRLLTFLNSESDPLGASYHIRQILLALGSGGLFGVGIGASKQKYAYLPEATTDSIFAVIAEELGFLGSIVIIGILLLIIIRGFKIAQNAPDKFGQLLAVGIVSWIGVQAVVNLAAMVALVPLTGVPLPFISYGGSSLVINLIGIGILLNISKTKAPIT